MLLPKGIPGALNCPWLFAQTQTISKSEAGSAEVLLRVGGEKSLVQEVEPAAGARWRWTLWERRLGDALGVEQQ